MRGRKPKPSAQRRLEGNPARRPLPTGEPVLPETSDDAPPELLGDEIALAEWHRLITLLRKAHVVTDGDRTSLVALCQQWSRYLAAVQGIAADGMVIKAPSGYGMPNPLISVSNRALGNCLKLWAELGLTPSSRTRINATPLSAPHDDAFAEFDEPLPTTPSTRASH